MERVDPTNSLICALDNEVNTRIAWIYRILPVQQFAEICRKVYFAVDDYNDIDFVLASGYLYYIFSEQFVISGFQGYLGYCQLCQSNVHNVFPRLPLLLPATIEVVAALTLGVRIFLQSEETKESR